MSDPLEDNFRIKENKKKGGHRAAAPPTSASGPKPQKGDQHYNFTTKEFTQPGDPTYGHLQSYFHQSSEASPLVGGFFVQFKKILKVKTTSS